MKISNKNWIYILLILFSSCIFEPDEILDAGIKPPDRPDTAIVDLNFSGDTILLNDQITSRLIFNFKGNAIRNVIATIDNDTILNNNSSYFNNISLAFGREGIKLKEGYYHFKLQYITSSATGSIADNLGAEGFIYYFEWILNVKSNSPLINFRTDTTGKFLIVRWDKFIYPDFNYYEFLNYWTSTHESFYKDTIKEVHKNYWCDSLYVGINHDYNLSIHTSDDEWGTGILSSPWDLPKLETFDIIDKNVYLTWKKSKYHEYIQGYYFVEEIGSDLNYTYIDSPDLRTVKVRSYGYTNNAKKTWILPVSIYDNKNKKYMAYLPEDQSIILNISKPFHTFGNYTLSNGDMIFLREGPLIYYYDKIKKIITDSLEFNGKISNNAIFFARTNITNNTIELLDTKGLTVVSSVNFNNFPDFSISNAKYEISDNGILLLTNSKKIHIYDLIHNKQIAIKDINYDIKYFQISPNGLYALLNGDKSEIYRIANNGIELIINNNSSYGIFDRTNDNRIFMQFGGYNSKELQIYDVLNIRLIHRMMIGENDILSIDDEREEIAIIDDYGTIEIFDFYSNRLFSLHPGSNSGSWSSRKVILDEQILYTSFGKLCPMKGLY